MKTRNTFKIIVLLVVLIMMTGCDQLLANIEATRGGQTEANVSSTVGEEEPAESLPMFYTSHGAHEQIGMIDLVSSNGRHVGVYEHPDLEIARTAWFIPDGAVYQGAFYAIMNKRLPAEAPREDAEAYLVKITPNTGEINLIGDPIKINMLGFEISYCGEIFATGMELTNAIGAVYGDNNLYRIDPENASLTLVGDTGIAEIMDLAFDPEGTLWATVGNVLYILDQGTGSPTTIATITGVEEDHEIMGIGFTDDGTLYGTTPFSDGLYTIDPESGAATRIGRHGFKFVHGGDIPMTPHNTNCEE